MSEQSGTGREVMRASDHDRNVVLEMLSEALGAGRISFAEYEQRSQGAVDARTYADLDRLVVDIPVPAPSPAPAAAAPAPSVLPRLTTKVGVMSEAKVRGPIAVGAEHTSFAFWGGCTIDLTQATFTEPELTITAIAIMGGVKILLPKAATVHVPGIGIMGAFEHKNPQIGDPGGPRITVRGIAFWGGVEVVQR